MLGEVGARAGAPAVLVTVPLPALQLLPAQPAPGRAKGFCCSQSHSMAGGLATQQIPHLNAGRPVSRIRTHYFKARLALQNKGKFLRGSWFPLRHHTNAFLGQPSVQRLSHSPYCTAASALQSLGMICPCFVSCIATEGQLHCAKSEALT